MQTQSLVGFPCPNRPIDAIQITKRQPPKAPVTSSCDELMWLGSAAKKRKTRTTQKFDEHDEDLSSTENFPGVAANEQVDLPQHLSFGTEQISSYSNDRK